MIAGRLYLVATPREPMAAAEFLARIDDALDGGVDVLQLRCKGWEALEYIRLAERVQPLAQRRGVPFIINDRPDVALAVGADGVHLGQRDLPVDIARQILTDKIVGRSSHEPSDAIRAIEERASYFAVGPVWETPTKPGRPAAGLSYVRDVVARNTPMPWFAIGGINLTNVSDVLAAGAERIAVVRAILDAPDSGAAAHAFVDALTTYCHPKRSEGSAVVGHPERSEGSAIFGHPERSERSAVVGHPERSEGSAVVGHPERSEGSAVVGHPERSEGSAVPRLALPEAACN